MSSARHKKIRIALSLGFLVISFLFAFQNCMQVPDGGSQEEASSAPSFPYSFKADTVGFMSCDLMTQPEPNAINASAYFTMRIGALGSGYGLSFTPEFYEHAQEVGLNDLRDFMSASPYAGTRLNMAVRKLPMLTSSPVGPPITVNPTFKFWDGAVLTEDPVLSTVYMNSAPESPLRSLGSATHQSLIGQVLLNSWSIASIVTELSSVSGIAVGFERPSNTDFIIKRSTIGEAGENAFGAGFSSSFTAPTLNKTSGGGSMQVWSHGTKVLQAVSEVDLSTFQPFKDNSGTNVSLKCPAYAQYKVVSDSSYAGNMGCSTQPDHRELSANEQKALSAANAILGMNNRNHWIVDQKNHCIIRNNLVVPHAGGNTCYTDISKVDGSLDGNNNALCGGNTGKICPHYFSICATYLTAY